jgi:hypothetical protein
MDGSEDLMINNTNNETGSNNNGDDSSMGSDRKLHKHISISELLTDNAI